MMELDCRLTPAPEMVVLRELESSTVSAGGFYLSEDILTNNRTGFCVVEAVGKIAFDETGLKKGDYVYADRLASHYHTAPIMVMKWDNVLLKTDKDKKTLEAMPGWALLKFIEPPKSSFITNEQTQLRHGIVKSINYGDTPKDECAFSVGDDVLITRACDIYDGFCEDKVVSMRISEVIARFD